MIVTLKLKHKKKVDKTRREIAKLNKRANRMYEKLVKNIKLRPFSRDEDWLWEYINNDTPSTGVQYE